MKFWVTVEVEATNATQAAAAVRVTGEGVRLVESAPAPPTGSTIVGDFGEDG